MMRIKQPKKYKFDDLDGPESKAAEKEIIDSVRKAARRWFDYWQVNIQKFKEDMYFLYVDQWDLGLRSIRETKRKQVLTINHIFPHFQKIIGEEIKNNYDPVIRPDPTSYGTTDKDAEIREGMLRKIFLDSNMKYEKSKVFSDAAGGGWGVFLVNYDYENNQSMHMRPFIKAIENPVNTFFDPLATEETKYDGDFCGYFVNVPKDDFYDKYPNATTDVSFPDVGDNTNWNLRWYDKKCVKVCYVWRKEYFPDKLVLLSNGESLPKKEAMQLIKHQEELIQQLIQNSVGNVVQLNPQLMQPIEIVDEREFLNYQIVHYKMIRDEILEAQEWPSSLLPMVYVDFNSRQMDGYQYTKSYARNAQDAQRYLNYVASQSADALMNLHHGNWIGTPENFPAHILNLWLRPQNDKGVLIAERDTQGQMPTYVPPPQISPAFDAQYNRCVNDIQNTLGDSMAARGEEDNAVAGVAIKTRAFLNNISDNVPFENLRTGIVQVAKVCLSLFPAIYDYYRMITIMPRKGDPKIIEINKPFPNGKMNDMSHGKYDVTIESGSSFAAQKEFALQQLVSFAGADPNLRMLLLDLMAENLDLVNTNDIVNRVQEYLLGMPVPQIIAQETGKQPPPPQPNPQAILAQQEMQLKQGEFQLKKNDQTLEAMRLQQEAQNDIRKAKLEEQKEISSALTSHHQNQLKELEMSNKAEIDSIKAHAEILNSLIQKGVKVA